VDYKQLSSSLQEILKLEHVPVGIKLLEENSDFAGYKSDAKYTFCQFIMKARDGEFLLATKDNVACANGSSALGFMPPAEKLLNGDFLATLGSFTKEGAQKTMEEIPRFDLNRYSGVALAPLDKAEFEPDIVVIETLPEHLMWLSLSTIHFSGGTLNFNSSISNGTCVDVTVRPQLNQQLNVTLGCYGCRNATDIPDDCLMAGFPAEQLEEMVRALERISEKAMPRSREKQAFNRLKN
jgi:uncharacterized protein (DUF169 family)